MSGSFPAIDGVDPRRRSAPPSGTAVGLLLIAILAACLLVATAASARKPPVRGGSSGQLGESASLSCPSRPFRRGITLAGLTVTRSPRNHSDYAYTCFALASTIVVPYLELSHLMKQPDVVIHNRPWDCAGVAAGTSQWNVTCTWSEPTIGLLLRVVFQIKL